MSKVVRRSESVAVIPTRNRALILRETLASIAASTGLVPQVIVVDSSTSGEAAQTERVCREHGARRLVSVVPNASAQRNQALDHIRCEPFQFVHFLDDDCVVLPGYFEHVEAALRKAGVVGAGGFVVGTTFPMQVPLLVPKLLAIVQGRVVPTGHNIGVWDADFSGSVDWLPGCSMSFVASALDGVRFDEDRDGYSLGEDVAFSSEVAKRGGALMVTSSARVVHRRIGAGRPDPLELARKDSQSRLKLSDARVGSSRPSLVLSAIAIHGLMSWTTGQLLRSQEKTAAGQVRLHTAKCHLRQSLTRRRGRC
jgi:GT2 family glycosyltransferase